ETQQAQDVTGTVADVNSRVASAEAAIAQLRKLLTRAGSVGALLTVQEQINQEEASLEALQSQQRALARETAYATISLTVTPCPPPAPRRPRPLAITTRRPRDSCAVSPRAGTPCARPSPGSSPWPGRYCRSSSRPAWRCWPLSPAGGGGWAGAGPARRRRRTEPSRPADLGRSGLGRPGGCLVHQVGDPRQRARVRLRQHAVAPGEPGALADPSLHEPLLHPL